MSTQPRSSKVAAKRRAVSRKRRRETLRRVAAIFFVAIFVLGTAITGLVFQQSASTAGSSTNVPAATVPPAGAQTGSTPQTAQQLVQQLITQGDQAAAKGDYDSAASYYKSALGLGGQDNATLHFDLGKAYIQKQLYTSAVNELQQALTLNPNATFASEANTLISTYKGKPDVATPTATAGSSSGTGASAITSTGTLTK